MIKFKDSALGTHYGQLDLPSATVSLKGSSHKLYLKFDSKDRLLKASYSGPEDFWLGSLCLIITGMYLHQLLEINLNSWDEFFKDDQVYWDLKNEVSDQFYLPALELLGAGLEIYRGRDHLFDGKESLICRCFGVTEKDVLNYIHTAENPDPDGLGSATQAGLGCRSCVPQLKKWLFANHTNSSHRFYKERSHAYWLLEIDDKLVTFPQAIDWKMQVKKMINGQVIIEFEKEVSQKEEEIMACELQNYLSGLDADLSFFLIRSRHLLNN